MSFRRCLKILLISALTVGVICFCCSCAVNDTADTNPTIAETVSSMKSQIEFDTSGYTPALENVFEISVSEKTDYDVCKEYHNFLQKTFSSDVLTRASWLSMLLKKMDIDIKPDNSSMYDNVKDKNYYDSSDVFITAIDNGLFYRGQEEFCNNAPATKQFICASFVRAMEFKLHYVLYCNDYFDVENKVEAATMVHLGYFELDENSCFNPNDMLSKDTVDYLLSEIDTLKMLKGKTIMSFGDSIMYGEGNDGDGIAQLISERYQTNTIDYSKGGSTFGIADGREQISNQILSAIKNNETADIILLNGGTNDMRKVECSDISDGFEYGEHGRKFFCNGMEYAVGLLQDNYPDTPLVYIRAHDMTFSLERNELHYGKKALDICEKWDVVTADVFNDTDFDAHDEEIKYKYTYHSKTCEYGDSVHPNRMGYYKYYIPPTVEKITGFFEE